MLMNIEQAIRDYLPNILHMSLGTCIGSTPWVCQVHFAYDDELNLYFCSNTTTRHSQEIIQNPKVAGSISVQHGPKDKPQCVDFEGVAEIIQDITKDDPGYIAYNARFPGRTDLIEYLRKENGGRLHKIAVTDYFVFDARDSSPAQKYHLPWHR